MSNAHEEEALGKAYDSRLMRRLLEYMRPYKWRVILALTLTLAVTPLELAPPKLFQVSVDRYLVPASHQAISVATARHGLVLISLLYMLVLFFDFLAQYVQIRIMQRVGQQTMFDMRQEIFAHIQRLSMSYFDKNPVGRLVTRVTTDVDALNDLFAAGVVTMINDFFLLVVMAGYLLYLNWRLALATLAAVPLILLVTLVFRKFVREANRRIRTAIARINAFLQEYISGMSIVQVFNRERRARVEFIKRNRDLMLAYKDAILAFALFYPTVEFLGVAAVALILWVGGLSIFANTLTLGVLVAFIQYAQRFFRPIQDLSDKYNILQAAMAASERVFKLLDTKPTIVSPPSPVAGDGSGRVEFRNVWFTYQKLDNAQRARIATATDEDLRTYADIEWILRGVSFVIEPDETAAIVGHTGAGKTTITSLMMRFYDIQRGSILVAGGDVRDQDLKKLRQRFGVVLQDPFLFSGTISDNIRLGSTWITDERLERAPDEVNVGDFIRTLPLKFAEPVRERGATLSTGQKQLISFARALAHDPGILILDEATSSVDTETEQRVRLALSRMITGRTSILIAHRLSTIQRADTILVMHKGQLRERGTHQQLLPHRGLYWKLYQLQYRDQEFGTATDT